MVRHLTAGSVRRQALTATLLAVCVLTPSAVLLAQDAPPFEQLLPGNTIVALTLKNPSKQQAYRESAVFKISQEPQMKAFCEHMKAEVKRLLDVYGREVPVDLGVVQQLLEGEVSLAFTGLAMGEQGPEPGIVISLVSPKGPDEAERLLLAALKMALRGMQPTVQPGFEHKGKAVKAIMLPMGAFYTVRLGDRVIATYGKTNCQQAIDLAGGGVGSLAEDPTFKKSADKTGWSLSTCALYLNVKGLLTQFGPMMPPHVMDALQANGLADVHALACTSRFADGGMRDCIYLHQPGERKGAIPPPGKPLDLALLKTVPKNAEFASVGSVDIAGTYDRMFAAIQSQDPRAYEEAMQGIARFEAMVGFSIRNDLIGSAGRQVMVSLSPYQSVLAIEVKNAAKFEECLRKLAALAQGKVEWHALDYRGRRIHHLNIQAAPVPVTPSYTIHRGFAVMGLFPQTLQAFLDQAERGQESILDSPDFRRVAGTYLKGCDGISYIKARSGLKGFYNLLMIAAHALHGVKQVELRAELMPHPNVIEPYLFDLAGGQTNDADGLLVEYYSPIGVTGAALAFVGWLGDMERIGGPHSVATTGILAAMLLPALSRARGQARQAVCKSNLKQIGLGMAMWSNDHNESYPEKLEDLHDEYITAKKIFQCPEDRSPMTIGKGIQCSYLYAGKLPVTTDPQVAIAWDKRGNHPRGRNVLYYDGHVEWVRERAFENVMERSLELLKKDPRWQRLTVQRRAEIEETYTDVK